MIKAFGKDSKGRVCAVGPISRTQYDYPAPARDKVAELKYKDRELKHEMRYLGGKIEVLLTSFGYLCHIVKELQSGQASFIASNSNQISSSTGPAFSPAHIASTTHNSSPAQANPPDGRISLDRSAIGSDMPRCSLVNFMLKLLLLVEFVQVLLVVCVTAHLYLMIM